MSITKKKYVPITEPLYSNELSCANDVKDFILEGSARISFPNGRLRLENAMDAGEGQKANYVFWCPVEFPSDVQIEWDFWPIREPGLCILFFAAKGREGQDLFDPALQKRTGEYPLYHHGDINAFHVSYFRRKEPDERQFHTCNLRKSYGFYLAAQGADPIPDTADAKGPYHLKLLKKENEVAFSVNDLEVFRYIDDGQTYGPLLKGGKIGFRQLAPLIGEYANLKVYSVHTDTKGDTRDVYAQICEMITRAKGNISLEECSVKLNYHPSYLWKILKKEDITFSALVNQKKIELAKEYLEKTALPVAQISEQLHYSNSQNFIRFFSKYAGCTPGEYRRQIRKK